MRVQPDEMAVAVVAQRLRMSEVISALSYALDSTEGQPPGHAIRSCLIGMRIADELSLDDDQRSALFYALLLKGAGAPRTPPRSAPSSAPTTSASSRA